MVNNDVLAGLVLAWAKEAHPEKYTQTVQISGIPNTFRKYLLRLIEIRWEEARAPGAPEAERAWMLSLPVSVLDETSLTLKARRKETGEEYEFKGVGAPGPRLAKFEELVLGRDEFDVLQRAKEALDLEYQIEGKRR